MTADQPKKANDRPYDLVVWGATGYTGRLVAEAAALMMGDRPWAIAGRSRTRLEAIRDGLGPEGTPPGILVADAGDRESMRAMTGSARAVLSTVGPFDRHGEPLVEAAIATGTHALDITGEVPWVRRMRDRHESAAREAGVRIVSMCGYDSVPSDLGVRVLQEAAVAEFGRPASEVEMAVGPIRGGVSGGTIASATNMLERAKEPEIRSGLRGDHALCVSPPPGPTMDNAQWGMRRSRVLGAWTAPFIMAGVNVSVVQRTNELLGRPWGDRFRYRESGLGGRGLGGFLRALAITLGTAGFALVFVPRPTRAIVRRWFLPAAGDGPDAASRAQGFFHHRTASSDPPVAVTIESDLDPGYVATARMLVACGLTLLEDEDAGMLDGAVPDAFCTPGALLGTRLVARLESVGFRIGVELGQAPPRA